MAAVTHTHPITIELPLYVKLGDTEVAVGTLTVDLKESVRLTTFRKDQ